jgi:uncharacterized protein involved in cysteine biosynthesis
MGMLTTSLALALRQLLDPAVLKVLLKSIAVSLVLFVLVAAAGWFALDRLLASGGLADTSFIGAEAVRGALSLLLALIGLWLTWRIVAMAVVQFYADEVVQAVERKYYPAQGLAACELSFAEQLRVALAGAGRALLANLLVLPIALLLLITGVGTFLVFWLVNAVLLGRELQDMVWLRHRHVPQAPAPLGRGSCFALGGIVTAMMAVPFVNFLAPVLGAASATHLVHRELARTTAA